MCTRAPSSMCFSSMIGESRYPPTCPCRPCTLSSLIITPISPLLQASRPFFHDKNPEKYLVLSVDDDPVNQMVVDNLLSPEGFQL